MVNPEMRSRMGQAGLCAVTAPGTDSLSPLTSTSTYLSDSPRSINGNVDDIQAVLSQLIDNPKDVKAEDVLIKLQSVINENLELKDTIAQNNLALRQQLNLIVQWNQQVENQQRQFRQTVNDLNKQLTISQQENSLLRSTLASHKNSGSPDTRYQEWHETIQSLNKQIEAENLKLEKALEERELFLKQRTNLEGEITLLKCDLTASRSESERLHLKAQEFSSTIKELQQKLSEKDGISSRNEGRRNKSADEDAISTLLIELQDSRNKIQYLEGEVQLMKDDTAKYKARYNELSSKEQSSVSPHASPNKRSGDDSEKRKLKDEAAMLREEVDTLETALSEERKRTSDERAAVGRMHSEITRLKREMQDYRDKSDRNEYSDQYYQAKIRSIHEQHDEATAKLVSYEELLGSKNDEIARYKKESGQLKAQMIEFKSEGETIAVLRAQVEVYQSDFRAEREAREAIATDREKLRDEMRHLHTRNTQLMDELEAYQRGHFNQGSGRSPRAGSEEMNVPKDNPSSMNHEALWDKLSSTSDKKEEKKEESIEVDENLFYCPKCNKTFPELRPLEEHVNRCLDED